MGHDGFLNGTVVVFGAALVVAGVFRFLRAPSIIGFLVAGMLIGPSGLRLIAPAAVEQFAEVALVLLLFTVGLELSADPLIRAGRRVVVACSLQVISTALLAALLLKSASAVSAPAAVILGLAVALSSTAIVLKQLAELHQTDSPAGLIITGVLLLQDVLVILVMLLLPLLSAPAEGDWLRAVIRGLVAMATLVAATLLARRVLPGVLHAVLAFGGRELMTLFAVLAACAGAYLAGLAGWSWALGACIAGLLLAETDVRDQLFADIVPFRDVFNALFFISMGMLVDLSAASRLAPLLLAAVAATLVVKAALAAAAVGLAGWPNRLAIKCGLGLCTVSEFAYVLAREADQRGLLPDSALELLTALIVGTMLLGAVLVPLSDRLSLRLARARPGGEGPAPEETPAGDAAPDVIIVGYGLNGHNLARVLAATKISYCVIEMNRRLADEARQGAARVVVGDATQRPIQRRAGLAGARALVIAINDQMATRRIVAQARAARSDLFILARTRYTAELEVLSRLGANQVIPEEFETSIEIFAHVLKHFGIPDNIVEGHIMMIRAGNYGMLRGRPAGRDWQADLLGLLEATATQTFLLERGSPACGRTIREIDLRARTGVTVIAVVRGGRPVTNPTPDLRLEAGDVLVLVGGHKQLDEAKALLAPTPAPACTADPGAGP